MSQPIRIGPLLTDSLRQIKETLRQFFDWTSQIPLVVAHSSEITLENNQDVINSQLFIKINHQSSNSYNTALSFAHKVVRLAPQSELNLPISLTCPKLPKTKADSLYIYIHLGRGNCSSFQYRNCSHSWYRNHSRSWYRNHSHSWHRNHSRSW